MLDKARINEISAAFCLNICATLPSFDFPKTPSNTKALKKIDNEPAEMLLFIAETAQLVYNIKPLKNRKFPLNMLKMLGTVISEKLDNYSIDKMPLEERLVLFWMSLVRILAKFKTGYYDYNLTDAQLDDLEDTAKHIQRCALGYKVCSEKKVREFIDKLKV